MELKIEVEDNTGEVIRDKDAAIARALEMMGLQCEKYAKMVCPVDTGRLRNSLTHEVSKYDPPNLEGRSTHHANAFSRLFGFVKLSV